MKTCTYNDVLYRAGELAGRTRDKLPLSEATMLQGFLATELEDVWRSQAWPELVMDFVQVTCDANRLFSKNEGLAGELGEILTVASANPRVTTRYRCLGFEERDDEVWVDEGLAQPWVEAMLPPPDLMSLSEAPLANQTLPGRFRNYLSFMAAAHLLNADVPGSGGVWLGLAERALAKQVQRLAAPPDWRQVRVRSGFGRNQPQPQAVQQD